MCDFRTGDIVECIDGAAARPESQVMPQTGQLYTVTAIRRAGDGRSVRLRELTPTCYLGGPCACRDCGWDASRFRKVYRPTGDLLARLTRLIGEPA